MIEGRAAEFTRIGDELGGRVTYSFCLNCETTVYYRSDKQPGLLAIPSSLPARELPHVATP